MGDRPADSTPNGSGLALVRRLSQYRPFERGGASAREAQEDLLAATLAELGGSCESLPELVSAIKTLFTVEFHQAEIERALGQMIKEQRVERTHDGSFALTAGEKSRLEGVARESDEVARTALGEWRAYLIGTWPGLTGDQLDQLEDQLRAFLVAVLRRHGAEATELLYPDDAAADRLYSELEAEGFALRGAVDADVEAIREAALSHFIRHPSDAQRQFLGQNLNTAYFLTLLSIDIEAVALVREITKGQWVYLDTNFIYRVLGIQGPRYVRATRTILETTKEIGYRCCVTPWTVDEFKRSLDRARQYLHRYPVPPADYAALLAETTSDEDFVTAYWRQVKSAPAKIDDFYAHWREVEVHLARLGIEIRTEGCKAIEDQVNVVTDEVSVLAKTLRGGYRHPDLLTHDAQHRLLIRRLRGAGNRTFANGGYWFLTFDSVLPRYDYYARSADHDGSVPFCVSAGTWFQIVEALRPKTSDGLQALADLLASPYVRYRRTLSREAAQAVVARVRMYEGADAELAARIMMNSVFIKEIEDADADAAEQNARIDNAIVAAAREAQENARAAQLAAEQERARVRELEDEAAQRVREADLRRTDELARAAARAKEASAAQRQRYEADIRAREQEHTAELDRREADRQAAQQETHTTRRRFRGFVALVVLLLVAVVGLFALGVTKFWAVALVVLALIGLWAAIDQLWISRS